MNEFMVFGLVMLFAAVGFVFGYMGRITEVQLISRNRSALDLSEEAIARGVRETRHISVLNVVGSLLEIALMGMVLLNFDHKTTYFTASVCCLTFVAVLTLVVFRFIEVRRG
jgi:hypothetical protein